MRHQAKTQGFWGWVVLGLCALAVLAGAYQSTRAKSTKDPQALETPNIIADQTDPKGDDAEEVSVPAGEAGGPGLRRDGGTGGARHCIRSPDHRPAPHRGDGGGLLSGRPAV